MNIPARRAAAICALLATTCITAPALAQSAQPSVYQHVDANGVDLTDGSYNFALQEGSIGSGVGAIALLRYQGVGGESDNLTVRFHRSVSAGTATISLTFGNRRETFTGPEAATSFTSDQGIGATLTKINVGEYRYTAADGSVTVYGPPPLPDTGVADFCSPGNEYSCDLIALSTTPPNGAAITYQWDVGQNCSQYIDEAWGEPILECDQFWRQRGLSNNSGYRIRFTFQQEAEPTSGLPGAAWYTRTGATLHNDSVSGSPVRTVSYATPAAGVTDVTTDGGETWRITRDANAYVTGIRRPGSATDNVTVAYSGATTGIVSAVTADGVTTRYARSVSGATATMTVTNALSQQTTVVSDLNVGRPTSVTDALNRTTSVQYDASGRPTRITQPEGNYTELTYDSRGNEVQTRSAPKPGSSEATITTSATYQAACANIVTCNLPTRTTDARGNATDYSYDPTHGGVLTVTAPAVTVGGASVRPQVRTSYAQVNGVHLPTRVSTCQTGASCANAADEVRTTIAYDANHLPTSASAGDGAGTLTATRTMTWDSVGNVETVDGPLPGAADTLRHRYDAARRLVGTVSPDPDGAGPLPPRATRITYRPDGQASRAEAGIVNSQSDADWAAMAVLEQVDISYDANDRPIAQSFAASGQMHSVSQTGYDALGRPECAAQRMNPASWSALPASACTPAAAGSFGPDRITRIVRDAAGQVTQVQSAVGTPLAAAEVTTTYSPNGRALTITDGENNRTSYEYDGHDRIRRTYFPLSAQGAGASNAADYEELGYDAGGNIVSRRNRAGEVASYTFDALGRITFKDLPGAEPDVTYAYDLLGRLTSASQPGHMLGFTWDALGRLLTQTGPLGTLSSTFDLAGRRTRLTHPDGFFVDYDYLATGEASRVRENGATSGVGVLASYGYDTSGRRTSLTRGNGTVTSYQYDAASRLSQLGENLAGSTHDLTLGFAYNPAGQIVSNSRSNDLYSMTGIAAGITDSVANGLNQIVSHGGLATSHDARGNMTNDLAGSYAYSSENLLTTGSAGTALAYDPNMRLWQIAGAATARFAYDGFAMVAEYDGANALQYRYVHGPGQPAPAEAGEPLVQYDGPGTAGRRFLHADERGSIVAHSDSAGATIALNRYDEYGMPASGNAGRFQYTGQAWLPEIGLHYYRARMYNPRLGRFMQTDPIGYGDGMNLYAYVRGDPVNFVDPSGTGSIEVCRTRSRGVDDGTGRGTDWGTYEDCTTYYFSDSPGIDGGGGGGDGGGGGGGGGGNPPPNQDESDESERAHEDDLARCRRLSDPAARSRCYESANARDFARRNSRPLPPLITWREAVTVGTVLIILYWVISEASRLFPPRNLIPIP